jgi:DNA end-binding protein Ku
MAPRANWKGYLRLSLVSCPIALYPASTLSEKVSFNRINRQTGNRLKQQNIDSETGDVVPREDTARGFEVAKGQYLTVEDQEIDAVQIESTRTIEIDQFVPRSEIDDRYIDSPYYIAPDGKVGRDAFAVIRDTIAKMNMVAVGRVVLTRREHIIALEARGRGLVGLTLRYPYEVRDEKPYFEDIPEMKTPKDMLDLATHIVQTKSGHFDPGQRGSDAASGQSHGRPACQHQCREKESTCPQQPSAAAC